MHEDIERLVVEESTVVFVDAGESSVRVDSPDQTRIQVIDEQHVILPHTEVSVVFAGEQGPPGGAGSEGPPGAQGDPGPAGVKGDAGSIGPPGLDGQDGEDGLPGIPGSPGPTGPAGAQGDTGPAGAPGDAGAAGLIGPPGFDGSDGEPGWPGPRGATGATGSTGSAGAAGARGVMGAMGLDGQDGQDSMLPGPRGVSTQMDRNAVINGSFIIAQRNTTFAALATGTITLDRWGYGKSGAMVHTVSQSTDVPTVTQAGQLHQFSLLTDCTTVASSIAAGDICFIYQRIEGYRWIKYAQRDLTLSFWVKGTKTGVHCVGLRNSGADRAFVAEYTINAADTWEQKVIRIPASPSAGTWNYTNGSGAELSFTLACGSTYHTTPGTWQSGNFLATSNQVNACDNTANDFRIAAVQLELGVEPTSFEQLDRAHIVRQCQRYFTKSYDVDTVPGTFTANGLFYGVYTSVYTITPVNIRFPVEMRATPTLKAYSNIGTPDKWTDTTTGEQTLSMNNSNPIGWGYVILASGTAGQYGHWTANAEI